MPRVQVGYEPGAAALQTVASPNIQAVKAQYDPRSSSAFQLAEALGKAQPIIDDFQQKYEREKFVEGQLQQLKKQSYQDQFTRDQKDGEVSAVQLGKKFPEMVPTVQAQVAEGIGQQRGKDLAQPIIQGVLESETLRLDTTARAAFLKEKRDEFIAGLKGDDFYKSGAIQAYDRELNQNENSWQRETAVFHTKTLENKLSREVVDTLEKGGDLRQLDETWKNNNGLGNLARNKVVVDTIVDQAFAKDDPTLLDKIDVRFRNAETDAKIQKMRVLIQEKRMGMVRDAEFLRNLKKEENLRSNKVGMINQIAAGKDVDPAVYKDDPEAFAFAMSIKDAGRLPEATSAANARAVRSRVLAAATANGVDPKTLTDQVLANPMLNPADKKKLIEEMPKLVEGVIAMQDDMVKSAFSSRIGASLDGLEKSVNQRIASIVSGSNLRSKAVSMFDMGIRQGFVAYYEENNRWPVGKDKQAIVDAQIEAADKFIESQVRIGGAASAEPAASAPAAAAAPKAAAKPIPTEADIAYAKNNPAVKQKFIDRFGREP